MIAHPVTGETQEWQLDLPCKCRISTTRPLGAPSSSDDVWVVLLRHIECEYGHVTGQVLDNKTPAAKSAVTPGIADPRTGWVVPDDLPALLDAHEAIDRQLRNYKPLYQYRDELLARIGELRGPVPLPRPSKRSPTQSRTGMCPGCGRREITDGP